MRVSLTKLAYYLSFFFLIIFLPNGIASLIYDFLNQSFQGIKKHTLQLNEMWLEL